MSLDEMAAKPVKVHVTHFEGPASFFFRFEDSEEQKAQNQSAIKRIESNVARLAGDVITKECAKVLGSVSCCRFSESKNKQRSDFRR